MKTSQILLAFTLLVAFSIACEEQLRASPSVEYIGTYGLGDWIMNMVKWWIYLILLPFIDLFGILFALFGDYGFSDRVWDSVTRTGSLKMSAIQ